MISQSDKNQIRNKLNIIQQAFPFTPQGAWEFAQLCIHTLIPNNPSLNRVQADILVFMLFGSKYRMVQAQRGQAKTTLAGIAATFMLIHNPYFRIVIFSQTNKRATEIMGWVVKIFRRIEVLSVMLPDRRSGDKDNSDAFDIHHILKGDDKSPSVSCYSITAGAQGARADFLIADDIESLQNSRTASAREWLEEQSKEFESINQEGDILYLGTPQSMDSIYNNLPSRGYEVRVWTGRYPTVATIEDYNGLLAPMLMADIEANPKLQTGYGIGGKSGAPTCPEMFDDEGLIQKEVSLGTSKFMLQQMLNTKLSDANRYPLKPSDLVFMNFGREEGAILPVWNNAPANRIETALKTGSRTTDRFYNPIPKPYEWDKFSRKIMYIDPSGESVNADEQGYAIVFQLGNMLYLYDWGAVAGGYGDREMRELVSYAKAAGVHEVYIEENFGKGATMAIIRPIFQEDYPNCELKDDYSLGQKEARIIDTLEPLLNSHRLIVNQSLLEKDYNSTLKYASKDRSAYSGFTQLSLITRTKGSLKHDDRLDALAGAVKQLVSGIDYSYKDKLSREQKQANLDFTEMMLDPKRRREHFGGAPVRSIHNRTQFNVTARKGKRKW